MPVSVVERLFTALLAAGVVTSFPEDAGELVLGLVLIPPIAFPEEPRLRALSVAGVFDPPVPLVVLPVESELPDAPLVEDPPDICANAGEVINTMHVTKPMAETFISNPSHLLTIPRNVGGSLITNSSTQ